MTRRLEHIEAGQREAERLGATFTYELSRGKHIIVTIGFNGQSRKTSVSASPSDWRAPLNIKTTIRRMVAEMIAYEQNITNPNTHT